MCQQRAVMERLTLYSFSRSSVERHWACGLRTAGTHAVDLSSVACALPVHLCIMDYIKKEWNSMTSEIRNMKKRQLIGSAVNLGQF